MNICDINYFYLPFFVMEPSHLILIEEFTFALERCTIYDLIDLMLICLQLEVDLIILFSLEFRLYCAETVMKILISDFNRSLINELIFH